MAADRDQRQYLNDTSVVPYALWGDGDTDEATRVFYGAQMNQRTRLMARAFGRL